MTQRRVRITDTGPLPAGAGVGAPSDLDTEVAIIGGGPVGKLAALMLGRLGHRVVLFERKEQTYPLPRAVAHDAEIARILQSIGMPVTDLLDTVEPFNGLYEWVNGQDEILHVVDWRGLDSSGWHNTYFYNQPDLERHIERRLDEIPTVEVRRGETAELLDQDETSVRVRSGDRTIRARWLLAADGAKSTVRSTLGIGWTDLGYFHDWLVVDVIPRENMPPLTVAKQVADPTRPTTVVPGGPGRRRWEFMRLDGESTEELTDPTRIWQLLSPYGVTPDNADLERGVVYTFASGWADRFREGRVLLLGDAAHQMPPFAGQGLAAGIRDCKNLAWKLDLVLRGQAPPSLLDTYGSERQAHVSDFIDFSISLGRIICILDSAEAADRDRRMKAEVAAQVEPDPPPRPRLGAGVHLGEIGGYLSHQGRVSRDSESDVRFDDVFGGGALILSEAKDATALDPRLVDNLAALGVVAVCFDPGFEDTGSVRGFTDIAGTYRSWFDALGVRSMLIRPDLYVFGAGEAASLAQSYLSAVTDPVTGSLDPA